MLKYSNIFANTGKLFALILATLLLNGCWSSAFTGASLIYDRHNIYIKLNDYHLAGKINQEIYKDKLFKCKKCSIDVAVFNRDVLMVGAVPNRKMRAEAVDRVKSISGSRRIFNQIRLYRGRDDPLLDSWITGNIRSKIIADSTIDPHKFKVVTSDRIVYLMGDVRPSQAEKVILFARRCKGVKRVVKLMRYYKYTDKV
ncbi:MAG: BON domain-containing protein [Legionellaceae bacterium]|nr:BON domain-containing protein [Legionellaceae bacterium]